MTSTLRETLRATQEQLLQTESQLDSTQAQLNSTKDQLEITHKTQTKLDECKSAHDLFITHTLAYDNRVYYESVPTPENITFYQQTCSRIGGQLVEIRQQHQYDVIKDFLTNQQLGSNYTYLGITDAVHEPQWTYMSDNSTVTFVKWLSGQPDGGQHCAALDPSENYEMRDWLCFSTNVSSRFMCEVSLSFT